MSTAVLEETRHERDNKKHKTTRRTTRIIITLPLGSSFLCNDLLLCLEEEEEERCLFSKAFVLTQRATPSREYF